MLWWWWWWWWWWWLCRYWCCSPRHRQDNRPRGEEICQILPVGLLLPLLPGIHFQVGWSSAGVALMFGWMDYARIAPHWLDVVDEQSVAFLVKYFCFLLLSSWYVNFSYIYSFFIIMAGTSMPNLCLIIYPETQREAFTTDIQSWFIMVMWV